MPNNLYYVIVKAGQDPNKTREIIGWNRIDVPEDVEAILMPSMDDDHWPPMQQDYTPKALEDGKIVSYEPPPYVTPLPMQAQNALQTVQQKATMVAAMGETFGPNMRNYVQILQSIANGSDTNQTHLPVPPEQPTQ